MNSEQLELRRTGIGASDVAPILGLSKFKTAFEVWAEKMGLSEQKQTEGMFWGSELERPIAREWAKRKGVQIVWTGDLSQQDPAAAWRRASPDFLIVGSLAQGGEVKTARFQAREVWGDEETDQIPEEYILQAQWQMLVMEWTTVRVPVFFGAHSLKSYRVEANTELQGSASDACERFWKDYVLTRLPPPLDYSDAAREYVQNLFPTAGTAIEQANDAESGLLRRCYVAYEMTKKWERERDALKTRLRAMIGPRRGIEDGAVRAVCFNVTGSTYAVTRKPGRNLKLTAYGATPSLVELPELEQERKELDAGTPAIAAE